MKHFITTEAFTANDEQNQKKVYTRVLAIQKTLDVQQAVAIIMKPDEKITVKSLIIKPRPHQGAADHLTFSAAEHLPFPIIPAYGTKHLVLMECTGLFLLTGFSYMDRLQKLRYQQEQSTAYKQKHPGSSIWVDSRAFRSIKHKASEAQTIGPSCLLANDKPDFKHQAVWLKEIPNKSKEPEVREQGTHALLREKPRAVEMSSRKTGPSQEPNHQLHKWRARSQPKNGRTSFEARGEQCYPNYKLIYLP